MRAIPSTSRSLSMLEVVIKRKTEKKQKHVDIMKNIHAPSINKIEWSMGDKVLIETVKMLFKKYPAMYKGGSYLLREIELGADSPRAKSGELQDGLRLLIRIIENSPQNK